MVPLPAADMAGGLAWCHRRVEFSSAPLVDVVAVVNRHNRVQFFIEDPELALVPLRGVFRLDDPGEFAHLLASGFALTAERRGPDLIVLRPALNAGCVAGPAAGLVRWRCPPLMPKLIGFTAVVALSVSTGRVRSPSPSAHARRATPPEPIPRFRK